MVGAGACVFRDAAAEFGERHEHHALVVALLLEVGEKRFQRGVELAEQASARLLGQAGLVLGLGVVLPVVAFVLLRGLRFDRINAAAVAAHYGSVSAGTFAVVVAFMVSKASSYMNGHVLVVDGGLTETFVMPVDA